MCIVDVDMPHHRVLLTDQPICAACYIQMVHFITRFDEEDERDFLAREHIKRCVGCVVRGMRKAREQETWRLAWLA